MTLAESRLQLGAAAVLSVSSAAELLPVRDADALVWIREHVRIRRVCSTEVVVWGDVVAALGKDEPVEAKASPRRGSLPRMAI